MLNTVLVGLMSRWQKGIHRKRVCPFPWYQEAGGEGKGA